MKWIKDEAERKKLKTPLTFTAEQKVSTIKMLKNELAPTVYLETSPTGEDGSWTDFIVGSTTILLRNVGDKVYFRAKQDNERFGTDVWNHNYFEMTGKIAASGNINTLLKADGSVLDLTGRDYCYVHLFNSCTALTQAPELPATSLASGCYRSMFYNCTSPFTFSDKTFDEVASLIQEYNLIGSGWYDENGNLNNPIEIICSDKTMLATFDENEYSWTLTEK